MDCPGCKYPETRVIKSIPDNHSMIRRRRECVKCFLRFTTQEVVREDQRKNKDVK